MPIHIYKCNGCEVVTERKVPFNDIPNSVPCKECQEIAIRQFNVVNIVYKGSGFSSTATKSSDPFDKRSLDEGMEKTVR